jgi:hypothetical protein
MLRLSVGLGLMIIAMAIPSVAPALAQTDQAGYELPKNLILTLSATKGQATATASHQLTGALEARVGTPKNLSVFFTSSDDLIVSPALASAAQVASGQSVSFTVDVAPTSGKPGAAGTFVKMRVVYLPDHGELLKQVSDATRFPVKPARDQLIQNVQGQMTTNATQTDVVDFRYPTGDAPTAP